MYLYHWVPDNFQGDTLIPLNDLKDIYPEVYADAVKKYVGREDILEHRLPILGCLWNDVIHLTAVPPSRVKEAMFEAGRTKPFEVEYFEIDPHLLDREKTIVYLYKGDTVEEKLKPENYTTFDPDSLEQYSRIPEATKAYYRDVYSRGINPLHYHRVPHILYKGTINTVGLKRITP